MQTFMRISARPFPRAGFAALKMPSRIGLRPLKPRTNLRFYSEPAAAKGDSTKSGSAETEQKLENTAGTQENASTSEVADLKTQLAAKDKEVAEYKDRLLRSVADFRNLQEVTRKDVQKAKDFALQKFAKDLLDSVDNFERALGAFKDETVQQSHEIAELYTGVKMTRDVFEKTLKKHGIEKLDPMGEEFDPNMHEATFELPDPKKEPGTVFHVQQIGFTLNNRVIRPAKVGIVKDPEN
ncbi:LAMI_0H05886g1_1 [Lachancea mirantina]|uniref:GrpE protein homolog n=1 Tax=Lachancea mirantina TaxID=1230905 RepID=A0A1G4KFE6_9SACH|nr:LAMI_0H05886g1_1 [Lachancea mirantina]